MKPEIQSNEESPSLEIELTEDDMKP